MKGSIQYVFEPFLVKNKYYTVPKQIYLPMIFFKFHNTIG